MIVPHGAIDFDGRGIETVGKVVALYHQHVDTARSSPSSLGLPDWHQLTSPVVR
jgi:hypothetical protein